MTNQVQPVFILPEGTTRQSGRNAQHINIEAAKQVADQVRTTLGPKGMDKMIVDSLGDVIVTNDGVTILKEMAIEHPSAKMIVEIAKTQENEVGDGTTTVVILAGELLKNAQELLSKGIHPTMIVKGYRLAEEKAQDILKKLARPLNNDKAILTKIAQTAMTGKGAEQAKEHLSEIVVKAITNIAEGNDVDLTNIKIEKKVGEHTKDTEIIDGIVIDKERVHSNMPRKVPDAKIALINTPLEIKSTEIDAKIQITDPSQMQAFLDQEEAMMKKMVDKIIATKATVVLCQKGIDDITQHYLAKAGILAARRVKQSDMKKLSMATGASIINNLEELTTQDLGTADVEEKQMGKDNMLFVQNCKHPKAVTILVCGGSAQIAEETKRAIDDALGDLAATIKNNYVVSGAGSIEIELHKQLKAYAATLSGREQLAVEAYAQSLEVIPRTLSENAGLEPIDILAELKSAHDKDTQAGIDVFEGKVTNAWDMGVIEPLKIKTQALSSATEVAVMILRIDDVIIGRKQPDPQEPGLQM